MRRGPEKRKTVPASAKLQTAWDDLAARRPAASQFHAHELPGADAEIERVLKQTTQAESDTASASFALDPSGRLTIEVVWVVDMDVVKRNKEKRK